MASFRNFFRPVVFRLFDCGACLQVGTYVCEKDDQEAFVKPVAMWQLW